MSKQVLSIEQMQHLKELGVDTSKGTMYYWEITNGEYDLSTRRYVFKDGISFVSLKLYPYIPSDDVLIRSVKCIAAFTLQDILDLLPATVDDDYRLYIDKGLVLWTVGYVDAVSEEIYEDFRERDLIDAAYEMLCWVVENGYLEV